VALSNNPRSTQTNSRARPGPTLLRPFSLPTQKASPLILWHLLSLDAPTVAVLWTWFLASVSHVRLPATSVLAMGTAVWLLYAADRLLDSRIIADQTLEEIHEQALEARHCFHHRHRRAFLVGISVASIALAALLPSLPLASIRLYLIEGSFLTGYFVLIHATRSAHRLPKELAVGPFFAAAIFIPTISRTPLLRSSLLAPAILFAALCSLNCLFIYAWEHPAATSRETAKQRAHPATRAAIHHLHGLSMLLCMGAIALASLDRRTPWPIAAAIALSITILLAIHHYRRAIPVTTLRAAADLALLTPLLFLGFR